MTNQLTDISVWEITLCKTGKNGLQFVAKAKDGAPRFEVPILKTDPLKKIVVGVVYEPDQTDTDGDTASAEEIQKAAWSAMKNHAVVNKTEHGSAPVGAFLAESSIVKANDPDEFPEGAWAVVIKVEDDGLWAEIEKGDITAFSMGGVAQKAPTGKGDPQPAEKSVYVDASVFATGLTDTVKLMEAIAQTMADTVEKLSALKQDDAEADSTMAKSVEAVATRLKAMQETVGKIAESITDGRVSSPEPGSDPGIDPKNY